MKFLSLLILFSWCLHAMEDKDYSLYDYNGLTMEQRHKIYCARAQLHELPEKNGMSFLAIADDAPKLAVIVTLEEIRKTFLNYIPDEKESAYRNAESAMLLAKILDIIPDYSIITKSQVHHMWRLSLKDVSWVLACCRKYPEEASNYIEEYKNRVRQRFMKTLIA